jgi:menaquinone-dependent protoporphyrinogen IX oxidase
MTISAKISPLQQKLEEALVVISKQVVVIDKQAVVIREQAGKIQHNSLRFIKRFVQFF